MRNSKYLRKSASIFLVLSLISSTYVSGEQESPSSLPEQEEQTGVVDSLAASQNVNLDFKEADIRNVLKIISLKTGVNIVTSPEVIGNVTIRLASVPWQKALDVILKLHGFGYEKQGNIIMVVPLEKLTEQKKQEAELAEVQPTNTEVFQLKYIDAQDAKKALEPQLSSRGKITVLEMTGQAGWEFGAQDLSKRKRSEEKLGRSKTLIVSDVPPALDKIREVVTQIDIKPQQILIETKIVEVNRDILKDIGFDWGTGTGGAESSTISAVSTGKSSPDGKSVGSMGGHILGSEVRPSGFGPKAGVSSVPGTEPFNVGLELLYKKLTGTQFETILHALEEDVHTNTLSSPRIMALNNQEATILIGTRYPILKTQVSGTDTTTTTITLDYYQDIGIQLNVAPQTAADGYVNMVIHPAVTSYTDTLGTNAYPIILTREAETRVLMKDGETVVIGGLLKDVKTKGNMGVPLLGKIPFLGALFRRETVDTEKIELMIFITARIIKEGELSSDQITQLEDKLLDKPVKKKKKKR